MKYTLNNAQLEFESSPSFCFTLVGHTAGEAWGNHLFLYCLFSNREGLGTSL